MPRQTGDRHGAVTAVPPPPGAGFFTRHTVAELGEELRAGRLSSGALVEHALAGVAALDPTLNAFVTVDAAGARAAARRADEELAAGVDRGPLHGIPVAVKDIVDTAGLRTTMGSRHFADHVPERDAECVRRLREAGAVIVGKTTTHEFAYGPTGDRSANGASRNPYRPERISGGSSGGSAVAVASGMVPLGIGSDTGGSVRIPAACCGIVGLKPTYGAVPTDGVFPLAPSLDTVGPMARTAADCRLLWRALSGTARDGVPSTELDPRSMELDPHRLRIGWVSPGAFIHADEAVTRAARAALDILRPAGAHLEEATVAGAAELRGVYAAIRSSEAYAVHADRVAAAPHLYDDEVLASLRASAETSDREYAGARQAARRARHSVEALLRRCHLLALPTLPVVAPPVQARTLRVGDHTVATRDALLALTSPWSIVGLPALTVPAGLVSGLPVGLQLVAASGREAVLLAVAEHLEGLLPSASEDPPTDR